ncbi:MAG: VOC family protein [Polyangiaceae bacterium]|nr:VOC family protein [Polyangiaceae bacterium]
MLAKQSLVAFIATENAAAARKFYQDVLGLEVDYENEFVIACNAHGTSLRIQKVRGFRPQPFTSLGWTVDDLVSTVDALADRGVKCERYDGIDQDARGIWKAPSGAQIAWFKDPDGNVLSLTQP